MINLTESVRALLNPKLIGQAAGAYGENEAAMAKAMGSLAAAILAGLLQKSGDARAADRLFAQLQAFDPAVLEQPERLFQSGNLAQGDPKDEAGHFLGFLFGAKVGALSNSVAAFSGAKASTVSALLGVTTALVMGMLRQRIGTDRFDTGSFFWLLRSERNSILATLPAGVAAVLGFTADNNQGRPAPANQRTNWLWPFLLLLVLGGGLLWYFRGC